MKIFAYVAILGLVISAIGVGGKLLIDHGYDKAMLELADTQLQIDQAWRVELKDKEAVNDKIQLELIAEKNNIKTVTKTITEEVSKNVKDNPVCNISRGAVSLHNQGWGHSSTLKGVSCDTSKPESEACETSTITQQTLIKKDIEYGGWCRELETSFDKLVSSANKMGY